MAGEAAKKWLRKRVEEGLRHGFNHAYDALRINPSGFLMQLRAGYGLPVSTFQGVYSVEVGLLDDVGHDLVRAGMKVAAVEGAGMGLGGMFTLIPDLSILAAITMRTLQKLSLTYGFEYNTDQEIADLWIAVASAAGVDLGRELLEKQVVNRFVPKVIQRVAVTASSEIVEKWSARMIPVASSIIGATLNYYFVRSWGARAQDHFRRRHLQVRALHTNDARPQDPARLISSV
jgi:hypothetical protein